MLCIRKKRECYAVVSLENCVCQPKESDNFQCSSTTCLGKVPFSFEWIIMWSKKWPPSVPMPPLIPDSQYSSYYPQYHQPLQMLLGKPLYLEVRLLNTPDPSLVLLVHYCVAYPRSGKAVWLLLYNGSASKHLSKENQEKKNSPYRS